MRPVEFSVEEIIKSGKELQAASRKVTGFALRQKVGGGSASRLKQVWDEYLSSQSSTGAEPVSELPVEVSEKMATVTQQLIDHLGALALDINDKAVKAAERRTRDVVRAAGEQRSQAESELIDAGQAVDDLERQLDEKQAEFEELQLQLSKARIADQAQAVQLAQVRERLTQTEQTAKTATTQHAAELARMTASIEADRARHHQELEKVHAELADQKQAAQSMAAELATTKARLETANEAHQEKRQEIDRLRTTMAAEGKARSTAEQQVAVLTVQIGDINARAHKFEKLAEENSSKLASVYVTLQSNRDRLENAAAEVAEAKTAAEAARTAATKAIEEAAELRGKYAAATAVAADLKTAAAPTTTVPLDKDEKAKK